MGKFRQILTESSAQNTPILSFPDDNLNKCQEILTKLGTCIDIKEIWFGIANGQIRFLWHDVIYWITATSYDKWKYSTLFDFFQREGGITHFMKELTF